MIKISHDFGMQKYCYSIVVLKLFKDFNFYKQMTRTTHSVYYLRIHIYIYFRIALNLVLDALTVAKSSLKEAKNLAVITIASASSLRYEEHGVQNKL